MQQVEADHAGDLMAAWWACGGAFEALVAQPETGDDGLQAGRPSIGRTYCDDGLTASMASMNSSGAPCLADDGLHAAQTLGPAFGAECFNGDDGLQASMWSDGGVPCYVDDGLRATAYSHRWPYCIAQ